MLTNIILGILALAAIFTGGKSEPQELSLGAATSTIVQSLNFKDELLPDGLTCSNGQILKKTATNDWDCSTDATGAGGSTTTINGIDGPTFTFAASGPTLTAASSGQTITYTYASSGLNLGTASIQAISFFLQSANNLSDLASTSIARTNLGLTDTGTLASSTWFKVANNLSEGVSSTLRTNVGHSAGTGISLSAAGVFANTGVLSTNGITGASLWAAAGPGLSVASTSQTITYTFTSSTLNLGTASIKNLADFLQPSNNLSELTVTSTARTNIGLGSVENTALSTWAGTSNITTLGTITTGTWTATDVAVNAGGTGTSTAPFDKSILTGEGGVYAQKTLTAGANITITTSTSAITITGSAGGAGTVTTSTAVTANYFPFWGSTSALTGTSTLFASSSRIGLGTLNPSTTLDIIGDFRSSATSTALSVIASNILKFPTLSPTTAQYVALQTTTSTLVFRDATSNRVLTATTTKGTMIKSAAAGATSTFYIAPAPLTIGRVSCSLGQVAGNTISFNIGYGSTYASTSQLFSAYQTCTATTTPTFYTSFSSSTPKINDMIWVIPSSTAAGVSSTLTTILIDFTFDE